MVHVVSFRIVIQSSHIHILHKLSSGANGNSQPMFVWKLAWCMCRSFVFPWLSFYMDVYCVVLF